MSRRVAITGLGVCTSVGRGVEEFWRNLLAGRSGIGPITLFDAASFPVQIGGEVKHLALEELTASFPEVAGERDRKVWLGLDAASQALSDADLPTGELPSTALFVGVSLETFLLDEITPAYAPPGAPACPPASIEPQKHAGRDAGAFRARLVDYLLNERRSSLPLQTPLDRLTQILGDHYSLDHGRYTNCSACAAGTQVVGEAFRRLRDGRAEVAIAGATDSTLNPLALGGFSLLHILSTENEQPEKACRPFDATRQGTVLGEGAAFLVMETLEHAQRREARVYAEVLGYGSSLDAYRVTDPGPRGKGAALSMIKALSDAGLRPEEIDCINAHGTGTPKNDVAETLAIKRALGAHARAIPVTANKSMTGHMIAASGAVEAVASVLTLFNRKVPPTINLAHRDPQCDLDYVTEGCRDLAGRTVLSNSFGFGGQNATLIFRRCDL
jgi:3-oxoacyl-[acyl-carrier-protein] synthase II